MGRGGSRTVLVRRGLTEKERVTCAHRRLFCSVVPSLGVDLDVCVFVYVRENSSHRWVGIQYLL
jgi:hypothetical protein